MQEHINLKRRRRTIAITALLIAAIIAALLLFYSPATVSTRISLQFEGIESGKNPDDTRFSYEELISEPVLQKLFQDCGLTYDSEYFHQFEVIPVLPENIVQKIKEKRIAGEDYTYFPNEFIIQITPSPSIGMNYSVCEQLAQQYVYSYETYFKETYAFPLVDLENIVGVFNADAYDYPEYETIFENSFNILFSYLDILERDDSEYETSENVTFGDLKQSLARVQDLDVKKMSSLIDTYNLSKDSEQLKIKYYYMIRRYQFEKTRAVNEYTINQTLLNIISANKTTLILPGISGESMSYEALNDSYDSIAQEMTETQITSASIDEEILYISAKLSALENSNYTPLEMLTAKKDVNLLAQSLNERLIEWRTRIEDVATDYFNYKYENAVTSIYFVSIDRVISPLMATVLLLLLWGLFTYLGNLIFGKAVNK
jgi:hypothetical protein